MTDVPMDRRRSDAKLDELIVKVDAIGESLHAHIEVDHAGMPGPEEVERMIREHDYMTETVESNRELLSKLVDLLEGEDIRSELDPSIVIDHRPGLLYDVRQLRKQSMNGGIHAKVQFTPFQKALITGVLGLMSAIVVFLTAILQNLGG